MKKFLFIVSAGFVCILVSCSSKKEAAGGMSDKAKKNMEASHIVSEAFRTGDVSKINDAVAADFVDHTDMGDKKGPDSLKATITAMPKEARDNMKMTLMMEVADDDYVFSAMEFSGTSNGEMGMPKGPYDFHVIEAVKFNKDSKAIEHWEYTRNDDMMKWMKMMTSPQATKDSTNM